MDRFLRRATPLVLLALAGLAWFGPALPGFRGLAESFGGDIVLRFVVGLLCVYMVMLVVERQRMADDFRQVLGAFRDFNRERAAERRPEAARDEAVEILIGALASGDEQVRRNAASHLERLTGQDLGLDVTAWRAWLERSRSG